MDLYRAIGRRVAGLRGRRGWTQERLAEAARLSVPYVARIEAGARRPTVDALAALARALAVPLWRLFASERLSADERTARAADARLLQSVEGLPPETVDALADAVRRLRG